MSKKTNLFVYDCGGRNPGDLNSCPLDYFDFSGYHNIREESKKIRRQEDIAGYLKDKDNIIFGGGGLLTGRVKKMFLDVLGNKTPKHKVITWGIGFNEKHIDYIDYSTVKEHLIGVDLVGIRDYGHGHRYVPCVSCMNSLFDNIDDPIHDIVIYSHYGFPVPNKDNYPEMTNEETSLEKIIKFLSSGSVVVTSAYHGVYWSMLLNRKVIAIPSSPRFYGFKYSPIYRKNNNWKRDLHKVDTQDYTNYLQECRDLNKKYYSLVKSLISR